MLPLLLATATYATDAVADGYPATAPVPVYNLAGEVLGEVNLVPAGGGNAGRTAREVLRELALHSSIGDSQLILDNHPLGLEEMVPPTATMLQVCKLAPKLSYRAGIYLDRAARLQHGPIMVPTEQEVDFKRELLWHRWEASESQNSRYRFGRLGLNFEEQDRKSCGALKLATKIDMSSDRAPEILPGVLKKHELARLTPWRVCHAVAQVLNEYGDLSQKTQVLQHLLDLGLLQEAVRTRPTDLFGCPPHGGPHLCLLEGKPYRDLPELTETMLRAGLIDEAQSHHLRERIEERIGWRTSASEDAALARTIALLEAEEGRSRDQASPGGAV